MEAGRCAHTFPNGQRRLLKGRPLPSFLDKKDDRRTVEVPADSGRVRGGEEQRTIGDVQRTISGRC